MKQYQVLGAEARIYHYLSTFLFPSIEHLILMNEVVINPTQGHKYNLNKSTSVLSTSSDMSAVIENSLIQTHGLSVCTPRPRRPTLKKSTNTLNTEGCNTPMETKRVIIMIDGNISSSCSSSDVSLPSREKSSTCEE